MADRKKIKKGEMGIRNNKIHCQSSRGLTVMGCRRQVWQEQKRSRKRNFLKEVMICFTHLCTTIVILTSAGSGGIVLYVARICKCSLNLRNA